MYPDPIIKIGSLKVYLYGLCIAVGIILCIVTLRFLGKKLKVNIKFLDFIELNGYLSIALGFLSASLFQSVYDYISNPSLGFSFSLESGMTFLGGLIGGAITFFSVYFIFVKKYSPSNFFDIISIVPCCILIAHAFGRLGCFFSGCCYGIETDSWLGVLFPGLTNKVYPTQLFEAIFLFIMYGVTFYLSYKKDFKYNFSLYLVAYGIFRFLLEFIRGDDRGKLFNVLSPSQFWSIIMVLIGIALGVFVNYYYKKKNIELPKEEKENV